MYFNDIGRTLSHLLSLSVTRTRPFSVSLPLSLSHSLPLSLSSSLSPSLSQTISRSSTLHRRSLQVLRGRTRTSAGSTPCWRSMYRTQTSKSTGAVAAVHTRSSADFRGECHETESCKNQTHKRNLARISHTNKILQESATQTKSSHWIPEPFLFSPRAETRRLGVEKRFRQGGLVELLWFCSHVAIATDSSIV